MTTPDLTELERLEREATPGPWIIHKHSPDGDEALIYCDGFPERGYGTWSTLRPKDSALVVAMRNALPSLLAAARRLGEVEAEVETARQAMTRIHPRSSHGLVGDIDCVSQRLSSNSEAWEEQLRECDDLRAQLTTSNARAEALGAALLTLYEVVDDNRNHIDDRSTRRDVDDALKAAEAALDAAKVPR